MRLTESNLLQSNELESSYDTEIKLLYFRLVRMNEISLKIDKTFI